MIVIEILNLIDFLRAQIIHIYKLTKVNIVYKNKKLILKTF